MTFQDAVKTCFSKYVVFSGRAQRSEFWWFALFTLVGSILLQGLDNMMFSGFTGGQDVGLFSVVFSLGVLLPSIAVAVRRLHDLGKSGWWYLLIFIPLLGFLVLLYFFVQRGTEGPNDFGPDPLA